MTTVGKILVVLHLVLSIMFMALASAVFTAQNNWKKVGQKTATDLANSNTKIRDLQSEFEKDRSDLNDKITLLTDNGQKLQGQNTALSAQVATLDSDNKQLRKDVDQQRDQAVLASEEAIERKKEADLQREKNGEMFLNREEIVKKLNDTEDERFALDLQLTQVSNKYDQLLNDFKVMKGFLASKDLTTDPKQMVVQTAPPPPVQGLVTEVRKAEKSSRELVEISIGSDRKVLGSVNT